MWITIKSLDPRTVLAALRRPAMIAKPDLKPVAHTASPELCLKQERGGTILSYDNMR